jgi:hypothetical protein
LDIIERTIFLNLSFPAKLCNTFMFCHQLNLPPRFLCSATTTVPPPHQAFCISPVSSYTKRIHCSARCPYISIYLLASLFPPSPQNCRMLLRLATLTSHARSLLLAPSMSRTANLTIHTAALYISNVPQSSMVSVIEIIAYHDLMIE